MKDIEQISLEELSQEITRRQQAARTVYREWCTAQHPKRAWFSEVFSLKRKEVVYGLMFGAFLATWITQAVFGEESFKVVYAIFLVLTFLWLFLCVAGSFAEAWSIGRFKKEHPQLREYVD